MYPSRDGISSRLCHKKVPRGRVSFVLTSVFSVFLQPAKGFASSFHVDMSETAWISVPDHQRRRCRQRNKTKQTATWTRATFVKLHYLGWRAATKPWQWLPREGSRNWTRYPRNNPRPYSSQRDWDRGQNTWHVTIMKLISRKKEGTDMNRGIQKRQVKIRETDSLTEVVCLLFGLRS